MIPIKTKSQPLSLGQLSCFILLLIFSISFTSCESDNSTNDSDSDENELTALELVAADSPNQITWMANDAVTSRNGDAMGYGVVLNPDSQKLLIFLDGGGACFNNITCSGNIDSFTEDDFFQRISNQNALIIDRDAADNQFADWNFVFVPYATGDVHSGSNSAADVPNGGPNNQVMTGFSNVSVILNELKTYFDANGGVSEIVFSGSSAGGFGMYLNTVQLASVFGTATPTTVLVDSGPVFLETSILTPCLESTWNNLWSLNNNLPNDLDTVVQSTYDFNLQKVYEYLAVKYPTFNYGFISTYEDTTIRGFYSFGQDNCPVVPLQLLSAEAFRDGLMTIKTNVLDNHDNWKVFYKEGTSHTFLGSATLNETVNGTTLNQWIADLRNGTASDLVE
ncbi:MAG: pectin acetylesterase-family hydrolase [Winogradskyella sp.]|uniref:pectin acetylesterase-family hydrolase n=1 Tax=Winogradskyella sp. TaxID=1883156 RepID=UPI00385AC737